MKRLLFIIAILSVGSGAYRYHDAPGPDPPIPPAKPRRWSFSIPGWQPITEGRFGRLSDAERVQVRSGDRAAIEHAVTLPGDAGRVRVSLLIRLGKGQHRPGVEAYWPALEFALGMLTAFDRGVVEFEETRGVDRGDIGTTVVIEEEARATDG